MRITILILLWLVSFAVCAARSDAIEHFKNGDYQLALQEFKILSEQGDHVAMVAIGNMHYKGNGVEIDYRKALHWWMKAYELGNADAFVNIGVLYRDGKGVSRNPMIAYDIFLLTQVKQIGGPAIQSRNSSNLIKTVADMDESQIREALCYSEQYISRYLDKRGEGKIYQYRDEASLKEQLYGYPGLDIPQYDCERFRD